MSIKGWAATALVTAMVVAAAAWQVNKRWAADVVVPSAGVAGVLTPSLPAAGPAIVSGPTVPVTPVAVPLGPGPVPAAVTGVPSVTGVGSPPVVPTPVAVAPSVPGTGLEARVDALETGMADLKTTQAAETAKAEHRYWRRRR